ncbi:SDR family NAD(P)-dependent oxidoreductase [Haloquadratum walsbyi]|jgi:Dehydrogenases with different specificities (related to short-chain alcohol dehydrogenases)|uniref:Dehydrogenase n=1 Tax=Haloquadratum walsbyi J07HQW2 TaxID=1238425 RepID=U1NI89_9EURY|nr:SDR family NAD(P)-dependent oxidoreductase [Haloquadratum walsbyi]ERG96885.1 MAG: dehydrogenase [Haloquadratum walsbyi J07HQW2]
MSSTPEQLAGVADIDCTGMQALVTGSTSGIGRATAIALGRLGADVIVHGRDAAAGADVVDTVTAYGADAQFIAADFADVNAVRELATTVRSATDGIDLLFNNAGGVFRDGRLTDCNIEYTFHINHIAPYLLTIELLDHLKTDARIVTTASAAHQGASLDIGRTRSVDDHSAFWAYNHSKLANILFTTELAKRLDASEHTATTVCVHPGAIPGSGFTRFLPGPLPRIVQSLEALPGVTSVNDGAAELLFAGISPQATDYSGQYFASQQLKEPSSDAQDDAAARRLWKESADILDIAQPLDNLSDNQEYSPGVDINVTE